MSGLGLLRILLNMSFFTEAVLLESLPAQSSSLHAEV